MSDEKQVSASVASGEQPPYPKGIVDGPCVCGSWPGGECLKCEWIPVKPLPTFRMFRRNVPTDTHDENQRNAADEPQFEGVVFSDGRVAVRWLTAKRSVSVWDSMEDMLAIHGHPEYGSELVWLNTPPQTPQMEVTRTADQVIAVVDQMMRYHCEGADGNYDAGMVAGDGDYISAEDTIEELRRLYMNKCDGSGNG